MLLLCDFQLNEMSQEINNILIENQNVPVDVSQIRKRILRTGNHQTLAYFLWKWVGS